MLDRDSIRALIRSVIEQEVGRLRQAGTGKQAVESPVAIDGDADLAAFARHVLALAKDPAVRADIEAGRHRFRLAGRGVSEGPARPGHSHQVDKGVVTEEAVARMEAVGYVTRGTTPEDGRGVVATMTDMGYDLLVRAAPCHVESVRRNIVDLVPAEDFAAVGRVFDRVADHLVNRHPESEIRQ